MIRSTKNNAAKDWIGIRRKRQPIEPNCMNSSASAREKRDISTKITIDTPSSTLFMPPPWDILFCLAEFPFQDKNTQYT